MAIVCIHCGTRGPDLTQRDFWLLQELTAKGNTLACARQSPLALAVEKAAWPFLSLPAPTGLLASIRGAWQICQFLLKNPAVDTLLSFDHASAKLARLAAHFSAKTRKANTLPELRLAHIVHEGHDRASLLQKWPYKNASAYFFDTMAQLREFEEAGNKQAMRMPLTPCILPEAYSPKCIGQTKAAHFRFMVPLPMIVPKDMEIVLHAMADLQAMALEIPPWEVHIVGEGHLLEPLLALAKELNVAHRLVLFSVADPRPYFCNAEAFILPTAFGPHDILRMQEAFALHLPLICSAMPGHIEMARDRESALFFPPSQPIALAGAMLRLLQEPKLVQTLTQNGAHALEQYTPDVTATRLLQMLAKP